MNIAFWDNALCERGTTNGLFNYAYYNETILNNKSFIFYDKNHRENKKLVIEKFKKHFTVNETNNFKEVDDFLLKFNITHIFIIKGGERNNRLSTVAKNCIQCVFHCNQPHGEIYCSISPWVKGNNSKYPVIPRIITLPDNNNDLRSKLNIPNTSIVFGSYGGKTSFDIKYVKDVIYDVAKNNSNIYFLFANFNKFCPDISNIIHLPMIINSDDKVEFINTCDAMIWGRKDGETFGQAIAEFSIRNKPVIATRVGHLSHYHYLGDKGIWYTNTDNLTNILLSFDKENSKNKNWNAYSEFTPEKVMKIFKEIFLN